LSFSGVAERLFVPFEAITAFADPSVQFALQFETLVEAPEDAEEAPAPLRSVDKPAKSADSKPAAKSKNKIEPKSAPAADKPPTPSTAKATTEDNDGPPDKPSGEVVRLDRFRKK